MQTKTIDSNLETFSTFWILSATFFIRILIKQMKRNPILKKWNCNIWLQQWFPTEVPRHTRVPQGVVRGVWITAFLLMFYCIRYRKIAIFNHLGVPPSFFKDLRGATNQKGWKTLDYRLSKSSTLKFEQPLHIKYLITKNYIKFVNLEQCCPTKMFLSPYLRQQTLCCRHI